MASVASLLRVWWYLTLSQRCSKFYLFEPICTAILLAITSFVHVYRIHAIYDKDRTVLYGMGSLYAVQIVVTAICCGFYRGMRHPNTLVAVLNLGHSNTTKGRPRLHC